jgi:hypothetical protein
MIASITKAASTAVDALKNQPLVLALVLINIIFLIAITFVLHEVSQSIERRDAMIERCLKHEGSKQ